MGLTLLLPFGVLQIPAIARHVQLVVVLLFALVFLKGGAALESSTVRRRGLHSWLHS